MSPRIEVVRPGLIVGYGAGKPVGSAALVRGSNPPEWVACRLGSPTYVTGLSDIGAHELLLDWAREREQAR